MGWDDMRRRKFLATTVGIVGGVLADRLPDGGLRIDGEPLAELDEAITGLSFLDHQDGAASVLMPATWLATRLTRALANTPPEHEEYLALAALTADAERLAGWVAFEASEYDAALYWHDQAIKAAGQARDPDRVAFTSEQRARVLWLGLGNTDAALAQLDHIRLDPVRPRIRAHVHEGRARALAAAGKDKEKA